MCVAGLMRKNRPLSVESSISTRWIGQQERGGRSSSNRLHTTIMHERTHLFLPTSESYTQLLDSAAFFWPPAATLLPFSSCLYLFASLLFFRQWAFAATCNYLNDSTSLAPTQLIGRAVFNQPRSNAAHVHRANYPRRMIWLLRGCHFVN